jgi:DNA replication protein DnaC
MRFAMRDIVAELKELRLYGMTAAWGELSAAGTPMEAGNCRWLLEHLLLAERADRAVRSVNHQMHATRFPAHRDLVGFDFTVSPVEQKLIRQLATLEFTGQAHNVVLAGGTGTGKSHLGTAIGVSGIASHGNASLSHRGDGQREPTRTRWEWIMNAVYNAN